jgi:hypothetical protein
MTTVMHAVLLLVLDRRAQAALAVLAALAAGLLLGSGEAAAFPQGYR